MLLLNTIAINTVVKNNHLIGRKPIKEVVREVKNSYNSLGVLHTSKYPYYYIISWLLLMPKFDSMLPKKIESTRRRSRA